jgi:hypothetical protein
MFDGELLEKLKTIPGWMGDAELEYLYNLVLNGPPDAIYVEIGTWLGLSTAAEYLAIHHDQKVCTIDTWLGQEDLRFTAHAEVTKRDIFLEFLGYMEGLGIKPEWYREDRRGPLYLRMLADDAASMFADESIYGWICDGDHEAVGNDLAKWKSKFRPDAKICGHDYNWGNVRQQVEEHYPIKEVIGDLWIVN